ncbi:class I SAM-dependent methyltransferase [Geobacter sp. AOG2]|uniref:class I SAM-dependent methyltransferase n=1 Tax=Geobacter sp. AOG2 TaxID=1566347 RepID=UPI001CC6C525|nr:class I SAM-dependent methyltransferase [Geobacter sp. AOG2]GFE60681.1 hypothetical protein AOG2_12690 [Geobacter sp. AOG2]
MKETDVPAYNRVALSANVSIYAFYATRILERTGISMGKCLDVGCGGGYLGLALSRLSNFDFVFLDQSPAMLRCAETNIRAEGLAARSRIVQGRVQAIPLDDASVNLVVSRGSVPFWDDLPAAFREIHRVLAPLGRAYVGGGLGPPELRDALREQARREDPGWQGREHAIPRRDTAEYREALNAAGIANFTVTRSDEGTWIEFGKG